MRLTVYKTQRGNYGCALVNESGTVAILYRQTALQARLDGQRWLRRKLYWVERTGTVVSETSWPGHVEPRQIYWWEAKIN